MQVVPDQVARWTPKGLRALGTDGLGRSDDRSTLRHHFEVDASFIVLATVDELVRRGDLPGELAAQVLKDMNIDPEKPNPATA